MSPKQQLQHKRKRGRLRWRHLLLLDLPGMLAFCNSGGYFRNKADSCSVCRFAQQAAIATATAKVLPSVVCQEEDDDSILVSKSLSTQVLSHSPSISSFTLVKGWSGSSLESLTAAVNAVIEQNPLLSGKVVAKMKGWGASELRIIPGVFTPRTHQFVKEIDLRSIPTPRNLDEGGQLEYIYKHIALLMRKKTILQQAHDQSPLFDVTVVTLPDKYACVHIEMSHCVGDLVTYFHVAKQISQIEQGKKIRPIDWKNPLIASHNLFPDVFTKRDIERSYGIPFFLGILKHLPFMFLRKKRCLVLSKSKIKAKAEEFVAHGSGPVSANDVITSALCDANRSSDIFALTRSMRGVSPGLERNTGGNLHCEIPFQRCAGRNPQTIRELLKKGRYFEPNEIPLGEFVRGQVGRITNCVISNMNLSFGGAETVCSCPPKAFLDYCPLDTAIVFALNKDKLGVLHNFNEMGHSELLDDLCATSQLLPMMHL